MDVVAASEEDGDSREKAEGGGNGREGRREAEETGVDRGWSPGRARAELELEKQPDARDDRQTGSLLDGTTSRSNMEPRVLWLSR